MPAKPSALARPSCGAPEDGVSVNRLLPTGCRPALLMNRVRPIWPMIVDVGDDPGGVTEAGPWALTVRRGALFGAVIVGCTGFPCAVTMRPVLSIWKVP